MLIHLSELPSSAHRGGGVAGHGFVSQLFAALHSSTQSASPHPLRQWSKFCRSRTRATSGATRVEAGENRGRAEREGSAVAIQYAHRLAHRGSLGEANQVSQANFIRTYARTSPVLRDAHDPAGHGRGHHEQQATDTRLERSQRPGALTPNHLLIHRPASTPPGLQNKSDSNVQKKWRRPPPAPTNISRFYNNGPSGNSLTETSTEAILS